MGTLLLTFCSGAVCVCIAIVITQESVQIRLTVLLNGYECGCLPLHVLPRWV
jgi:hypothetical protein